MYLCSEFNRYEAPRRVEYHKIKIMDKNKKTLRSSQEGRVAASKKGTEVVKGSLQAEPRYQSAIPLYEPKGVTKSKRDVAKFEDTPKGIRRAIFLNPEYDTLNSLWSAEKVFYLLYCLNMQAEAFNKYVLPLRESRLKKPMPYFKTLTAFLEWIEETNPKAVKETLRDVILMMSNNDRGLILPDEGGVGETDEMAKYYKELSLYISERIKIIETFPPEKEEE